MEYLVKFLGREVNIGEKDGTVKTTPIIKKCNVYEINFYDGVLEGFDYFNSAIYETEIGYIPKNNGTEIVLEKSNTIEAKIEEKEYYAIENAISEATDGQTIQISNNISRYSTGAIGIDLYKNIIIDLNGKNIVSNGCEALKNDGTLTIIDNSTKGNGEIEGTVQYGIYNCKQLTIKGGNIYGNNNGIVPTASNVIVEGGTIVGKNYCGIYNDWSNVTITGGEIRGKKYGIYAKGSSSSKYSITLGKKDSDVSTETPIVSGEQYGIYTEGTGTFNFYDGKVIGNTKPIEPETGVNNKPNGYEVVVEENVATLQLQQHTIKYTIEYYTSNNYKENKEKSETVPITQDKLTVDKNEIKEKTFDGYKFSKITIDGTDYKSAEEIPNEVPNGTTIKVYYLREMTVKAEYLDKATGKQIEKDEITNGVEGDNYKTEEKKITGYKFDSIVGKPEGQMQLEYKEDGTEITEILVKYYYTKVENNVLGSLFGSNNSGGENNPVLSNIISGINTGDAIPIIAISVIGIVVIANVVIIVKRKKNKKA